MALHLKEGDAAPSSGAPRSADDAEEAAMVLLQQFRVVLKAVKSHFRQVERVTGVGGSQVWALSLVAAQPGVSVGELARALGVRQPTASVLVRHLVQQRLIESVPNPQDRRSVRLHPTAAGHLLLQRAPQPFSGVLPKALSELDPVTQRRMIQGLGELIHAMGADPGGAGTPLDQL